MQLSQQLPSLILMLLRFPASIFTGPLHGSYTYVQCKRALCMCLPRDLCLSLHTQEAGAPGLHGTCGMKAQNTCFWDQYNTQAPGPGGRVVYSCCGYCSCRHLWKVCILLRVLVHFKSFQVKSGKSDWRSSRLALQWKTKQAQSV